MEREQKKEYTAPEMSVVELKQQTILLQGSNGYGGEVAMDSLPFDDSQSG